jgi:hypothetical protein
MYISLRAKYTLFCQVSINLNFTYRFSKTIKRNKNPSSESGVIPPGQKNVRSDRNDEVDNRVLQFSNLPNYCVFCIEI